MKTNSIFFSDAERPSKGRGLSTTDCIQPDGRPPRLGTCYRYIINYILYFYYIELL